MVKYNSSLAYKLYQDIKNLGGIVGDDFKKIEYNFMRAFRDISLDKISNAISSLDNNISIFSNQNIDKSIDVNIVGESKYYFDNDNRLKTSDVLSLAYNNMNEVFGNERIGLIESQNRKVKVNGESLKHGITKINSNRGRTNSFVISNVGTLIKNAEYLNSINPSKNHPNNQMCICQLLLMLKVIYILQELLLMLKHQ